ncbi:MAG: replication initiation factor domain-containing protein [Hydrogenoanaerobacterium sp.]
MNKLLIDWLSFSVRIDTKNPVIFKGVLDLSFIADFLGISLDEFSSCGKVKWYKERYDCNNISVSVPFEHNENKQGYFISMSGKGCRFFENTRKCEDFSDFELWRLFFMSLRHLNEIGLSVNVSRVDFASDDFDGNLQIDNIIESVSNREVASRFQNRGGIDSFNFLDIGRVVWSIKHDVKSSSVTFGSRQSSVFCRFYDKKAEQLQKNFKDDECCKTLFAIPHWVRMEFEFHDDSAIEIINALCDDNDFSEFYSAYVNGMLRFINITDTNVTRCESKKWWLDFIGTTEHIKLSCGDYKPVSRERHLDYVYNHLSGAIYTAMNIDGVDKFLHTVCVIANGKLKEKYRKLCAGLEFNLKELCSAELWEKLKPAPYNPVSNGSWCISPLPVVPKDSTEFFQLTGKQTKLKMGVC